MVTFITVVIALQLLSAVCVTNSYRSSCAGGVEHCVVGLCNVLDCSVCEKFNAVCNSISSGEPVPQTLSNLTETMTLTYDGAVAIQLTPNMFNRYPHIQDLNISGNIIGISPMTFAGVPSLERLTIMNTKIQDIPFDTFREGARLRKLVLSHNNFSQIPYHLFGKIKKLEHLDLSYNPIQICDGTNRTIGEQFSHFSYLSTVKLAGLGDERCASLPDRFLSPMKEIQDLDLSESRLLIGNPKLLLPLNHLSTLHLSNLEPYKHCPSKIAAVFGNMPAKVNTLILRGWRGESILEQHCFLNETSLAPLKKMKISFIDFSESDWIIGGHLRRELFAGFSSLKTLFLSWTRLNLIDPGAFQDLLRLTTLSLKGNQLGPRKVDLYGSSASQLISLSISNIGILHEKEHPYNVQHMLYQSLTLKEIFFNGNLLTRLPSFTDKNISKTHNSLLKLSFDDNMLSELSSSEMEDVCAVMPNLRELSAQRNRIFDVTGLCSTLHKLVLDNNDLGSNSEMNLAAVKKLTRLSVLSLNSNGIDQLSNDLVQDMKNLTTFLAADNAITSLPAEFFKNNQHLSIIDLSQNLIKSLDVAYFSYSVFLSSIYFSSNQLTTVPQSVRKKLDDLTHLAIFDVNANPFDCYCGVYGQHHFQDWINLSPYIADVKNLTCAGEDGHRTGNFLYNYTQNPLYCKYRVPLIVVLAIFLTLILVAPLAIKIYKYRWYIRNPRVVARAISTSLKYIENEHNNKFAAIVSYDKNSEYDIKFIQEYLIPEVEDEDRHGGHAEISTACDEIGATAANTPNKVDLF